MSFVGSNILAGASGQGGGGYEIERSLRFNAGDSSYLNRTPSSAGNRKTWTWSGWVKRSVLGSQKLFIAGASGTEGGIQFHSGTDNTGIRFYDYQSGSHTIQLDTTQLFRDVAGWYHIVGAIDTTQATASDRAKLYINGVQVTSFATATYPSQNLDTLVNNNIAHYLGWVSSSGNYFNGYLADVHFIDGQALAATDFGETDDNGVWQPKKFAGTYFTGVNNATGAVPIYNTTDDFGLVKGTGYQNDSFAGTTNGTGLVLAIPGDVATDVHHNINTGSSQATVTNDGVAVITSNSRLYGSSLQFESANTDSLSVQNLDMALGTGDLCVEFWVYNKTNKNYSAFISTRDSNGTTAGFVIAGDAGGDLYVHSNVALAGNYSGDLTLPLNQWSHVAYTRASGTHRLFLNGVAASNSTTTSRNFTYGTLRIGDNPYGTDEPINAEMQDIRVYKGVAKYTSNFTVPARTSNGFHLDFKDNSSNAALGTDTSGNSNTWTVNNLTAAAAGLATANQGMDVVTYSGNGGTQSISSLAFQPDFVWIKNRTIAYSHLLYDVIRGNGSGKALASDTTGAEGAASDGSTYGYLNTFNTDGFSVVQGSSSNSYTNGSGQNYVAWCWKAGGAAVSNTDGSINSSVSVNAAYGFSITKYVGTGSLATVGHGLGSSAPKFMLIKGLDDPLSWAVYANSPSNYLQLNDSGASSSPDASNAWNGTAPTSSVFTVKTKATVNESGENYIAYCWSEVAGFSKFSSYTGTGSANKVVTGLGFKPRYLLIKRTNGSIENWQVVDSERGTDAQLHPDLSQAETTTASRNISFQDDGFTIIGTNAGINGSGDNYIYAAFAAKPDGSVIDSLRDSPSQIAAPTDTGAGGEVVGNYATLNPLESALTGLNNGNLNSGASGAASWKIVTSTIAVSSGKYYWEGFTDTTANASAGWQWGVCNVSPASLTTPYGTSKWSYQGAYIYNQTASQTAVGTTAGANDLLGYALDMDAGTLKLYVNNSLVHTFTGLTGTVTPFVGSYGAPTMTVNFGQHAFAYTAPSGYKSLNTANLPTPTIADGSKYFDTKLWAGNNSTQAITGLGFSPDFVWAKARNSTNWHELYDTVRGNTVRLFSNTTDGDNSTSGLASFDTNGFTLNNATGINNTSSTNVGWAWDAGSSNTTIAAGSLNSSVYNQSAVWSGMVSPSPANGTLSQGFNGNLTNTFYGGISAGAYFTFTPTGGITFNTQIRVYNGNVSATSVKINGGSSVSLSTSSWTTVATGSGTLNTLAITRGTTDVHGWFGIEIDGKILVDYGVTPANVPSIASTVRANPSAGFSIVTASPNNAAGTIGHGLNEAPALIISKSRTVTYDWNVFHQALGTSEFLRLNAANAPQSVSNYWGTGITSSTFGLASGNNGNNSGDMVYYCFAPVEGYSAMGSHTNGSSNNQAFIYTGFRPAWIIGRAITADWWTIYDSARNTHNPLTQKLWSNVANAEAPQDGFDFLSNGFKCIAPDNNFFASSANATWIYMAFAENSIKTARAR